MKKALLTLSSGLMAITLMTGCGAANNRDMADNNNNGVRNVGYYTNQGKNPDLIPDNDIYPNNRPYMRNADVNDNRNNYYQWDTKTARRISSQVNRLNGVRDSSVLISGNTVLVGVVPENNNQNTQKLDAQVRKIAKGLAPDKQIRVVTDKNIVGRIMDVNQRIGTGSAGREVQSDVQGILNDVGDIIKRPFQNNTR
ncbi:MAG: YhcN/YlaJ family sporulation lipoprotein [Tuberibacillus sp.]